MIQSRHRRFPADRRAAAALEFAMVCGPFVMFILAVMGIGLHFFLQQALDYTTQGAARQVQLGNIPANYTQSDFLTKVFCPIFGSFQACINISVDIRPVSDYQQLTKAGDAPDSLSTTGLQFCAGKPGQLMYVHVIYLPPTIGGSLLYGAIGGNGPMVANAAFANENPGGNAVAQANGC